MDSNSREINLPPDHNSTTSSSFNSSPPNLLRNIQAAYKRHRMMPQANNLQPRRLAAPRREIIKSSAPIIDSKVDESQVVSVEHKVQDSSAFTNTVMTASTVNHESVSITPPLISHSPSEHGKFISIDGQRGQTGFSCDCRNDSRNDLPCLKCGKLLDGPKKVQFASEIETRSHGSDDHMDSSIANLLTHMGSLSLTEMESNINSQIYASTDPHHDVSTQLRNFLQSDFGHQMTSSTVVGSTCATTTLVNSVNAPMLSSTTQNSQLYQHESAHAGNLCDMNYQQQMAQGDMGVKKVISDRDQHPSAAVQSYPDSKQDIPKDPPPVTENSTKGDVFAGEYIDLQPQNLISNDQISTVKPVTSKSDKNEKPASKKDASAPRKRSYDPDLFIKVNGKKYQRLGKIGSGGSSEVHKVISQDCTVYALKKIKLKGRDYATAYGFCQEIEYLNKLKGKDHIIQLIDYEVTDKALLKEVLSGSMTNSDGRVKDDGCIYMVLEYGEIDLAHMLSQLWRELDSSRSTIDENWLRFYWQQILKAVKTIHEERIVHSDLKPANFLLVRGSLKLIDFGIAKAIMSDTTNIQRDSQVGTLSYMSPEAFMCNETDANGNTIKCGRPSDIWSLGCILYQMVYGRTPFADYTTFWAKFKVITDPNHEIRYEPLSNIWLLDLMKKCLAWDRKERWTIPQLLQHPFLVPPIPPSLPNPNNNTSIIQLLDSEDTKTRILCYRIQELVNGQMPNICKVVSSSVPLDQKRLLIDEVISNMCCQVKDQLDNSM